MLLLTSPQISQYGSCSLIQALPPVPVQLRIEKGARLILVELSHMLGESELQGDLEGTGYKWEKDIFIIYPSFCSRLRSPQCPEIREESKEFISVSLWAVSSLQKIHFFVTSASMMILAPFASHKKAT